jgi:hypothetical protein
MQRHAILAVPQAASDHQRVFIVLVDQVAPRMAATILRTFLSEKHRAVCSSFDNFREGSPPCRTKNKNS